MAVVFFGLPILIILLGIVADIFKFEAKCKDITEDKKFMKEQVSRMEDVTCDFIGQKISEKIDEGIEYYVNPTHKSMGTNIEETKNINHE